jgi:hypothetical protein
LLTWALCRFVILSVVLFGLVYNPHEACSLNLVDHGRGYLGILLSCMIAEMAIIWLSMRGGILYTEPRDSMQYVLYVRLGKGRPFCAGGCSRPPLPASFSCAHLLLQLRFLGTYYELDSELHGVQQWTEMFWGFHSRSGTGCDLRANKVLLEHIHSCMYPLGGFSGRVAEMSTVTPRSKTFALWPFTDGHCQLLF